MNISWMENFNEYWVETSDRLYKLPDRRHIDDELYDGGDLWDKVGMYLVSN